MPQPRRPAPDLTHIAEALRPLAVPIATLSADPANLRRHTERGHAATQASLQRFGQRKPIIVDAAGVTIAGAGVLEAARALGWTHVAAARNTDLTGAERMAYAIADNRTAELSEWSDDLAGAVSALPEDLRLGAGFTTEELAELLTGSEQPLNQDEIPEPLPTATAQRGDLWLLGDQRLLCGDCTDLADVKRVMDGQLAALIATDPPYLVGYDGSNHRRGPGWSATYGTMWDDSDTKSDLYRRFIAAAVAGAAHADAAWYCWYASARQTMLEDAWRANGLLTHCQIIWVKNRPILSRTWYLWAHEPCVMGFRKGRLPEKMAGELVLWDHEPAMMGWKAGNKPDRLALQPILSSVWHVDTIPNGQERPDHPTPKPLELYAIPVRQHTRPGDVMFEPFSGSGTAIIVAEQLGRRCRAIEIQPVYIDVAIRRWQKLTGKPATLEGDGRTWAEITETRGGRKSDADPETSPRPQPPPAAPTPTEQPGSPRRTGRPRAARSSEPPPPGRASRSRAAASPRS